MASVLGVLLAALPAVGAHMALDKVVVDLAAEPLRDDIEVHNTSEERLYVVAEPARIDRPGTEDKTRVRDPDPQALGLLVSPNRLVLEPGQRRLVRVAALGPPSDVDRIYRVTIKPVAGQYAAKETQVKVFIGFDVLVIVRPRAPRVDLQAERVGRRLVLRNAGNTNVLLLTGSQCRADGADCVEVPGRRLYAGTNATVDLAHDTPVSYYVNDGKETVLRRF